MRNYVGDTRRTRYSARMLLILLVAVSCLAFFSNRFATPIVSTKNFICYLFLPSETMFEDWLSTSNTITIRIKQLFQRQITREVFDATQAQVHALHMRCAALDAENKHLKTLLDYRDASNVPVVPARVMGRAVDDTNHIIVIDKGTQHHIEEGCVVTLGTHPFPTLVGQVVEAGSRYAKVLLTTDMNSAVSSYAVTSGVDGVIEGNGTSRLVMRYIYPAGKIGVHDVIITSGYGGIFPHGLYVGSVCAVVQRSHTHEPQISIQPGYDTHIRTVFVITKEQQ